MKRLGFLTALVAVVAAIPLSHWALSDAPKDPPAQKVAICHVEGNGTGHVIYVSETSYQAHQKHGDCEAKGQAGDPCQCKIKPKDCHIRCREQLTRCLSHCDKNDLTCQTRCYERSRDCTNRCFGNNPPGGKDCWRRCHDRLSQCLSHCKLTNKRCWQNCFNQNENCISKCKLEKEKI